MGFRKYPTLFMALILGGCGSLAEIDVPIALGPLHHGPPNMTVTFLPRPIPYEEISEYQILTNGLSKKRVEAKVSTPKKLFQPHPFPTVLFPFDSWEIHSDVSNQLEATAEWMHQFPTSGLRIEGHTDVRGTESYNMVLGAKRAYAVKQYLAHLGVPSQRLETVSYGKENSLCDIDDESTCHQYNSRAELMLE